MREDIDVAYGYGENKKIIFACGNQSNHWNRLFNTALYFLVILFDL